MSAIDVLTGIGWLDHATLKRWRQGQLPYLEHGIQTNLARISEAMRLFASGRRKSCSIPARRHTSRKQLRARLCASARAGTGRSSASTGRTGCPEICPKRSASGSRRMRAARRNSSSFNRSMRIGSAIDAAAREIFSSWRSPALVPFMLRQGWPRSSSCRPETQRSADVPKQRVKYLPLWFGSVGAESATNDRVFLCSPRRYGKPSARSGLPPVIAPQLCLDRTRRARRRSPVGVADSADRVRSPTVSGRNSCPDRPAPGCRDRANEVDSARRSGYGQVLPGARA